VAASVDLLLSPRVRLLLPPIRGRPSCYPAVMSTPTAFHALAKLPQTTDSLEQINTALQADMNNWSRGLTSCEMPEAWRIVIRWIAMATPVTRSGLA
jgi:hypothetical protein